MSINLEQFGIDRLSVQERFELIGLIWDSIDGDVPFNPPSSHLEELARRLARADAHPEDVEPWDQLLARMSARYS